MDKEPLVFRTALFQFVSVQIVSTALVITASGCVTSSHADQGALIGGGMGALTGATLAQGHPLEGALVGGMIGAAAGTVIGDAEDARDERDAAMMHAARVEAAAAQALSNHDIVNMTANGLGEDVIITSIQTRGGRFEVGPDALISLKSSGVSDRVIQTMQSPSGSGIVPPANLPPTVVVGPPPPPVIVRNDPAVEFGFFVGPPGPGFGYHRHHHRRPWRW